MFSRFPHALELFFNTSHNIYSIIRDFSDTLFTKYDLLNHTSCLIFRHHLVSCLSPIFSPICSLQERQCHTAGSPLSPICLCIQVAVNMMKILLLYTQHHKIVKYSKSYISFGCIQLYKSQQENGLSNHYIVNIIT